MVWNMAAFAPARCSAGELTLGELTLGELGSLLWETEDSPLVNMPSLGFPGAAILSIGM